MKVLIATEKAFSASARDEMVKIMEGAGLEVALLENYKERSDLLKAVVDVDGIIIRSDIINQEVLEVAKNLKIVIRGGAGTDNVKPEVQATDIVVENTPGQNSNAVAELAFGLMIMMARKKYSGVAGTEVFGKTLGLQGFGNIGLHMRRIAKAFNMKVMAYDPFLSAERFAEYEVEQVDDIAKLYKECDFVSLHVPATKETKGTIGKEYASMMKKGATLINTARAEVIDEPGLLSVFKERGDLKYCADVAPKNKAEFPEAQVLFTAKKMGAQTAEANANCGLAAANQMVEMLINNKPVFQVNKK